MKDMTPEQPAPIRINIPSAHIPSPAHQAADVAIGAIREAGIDPWRAAEVPMIRALITEWLHGRMTRGQFIDNCRKVAILNPSLLAR